MVHDIIVSTENQINGPSSLVTFARLIDDYVISLLITSLIIQRLDTSIYVYF